MITHPMWLSSSRRHAWLVKALGWLVVFAWLVLLIPAGSEYLSRHAQRLPAALADATLLDPVLTPALTLSVAQRERHLARLKVDRWHELGYRGHGVKVAILDSGFRGYRKHLGKALPGQVLIRSFRGDGNLEARDSGHGILCAEVIHALAPDADLLFANWDTDRPDEFLQAVQWARAEGARVISCSVIEPDWSDGEGGGSIHRALRRLLGPGGRAHDPLFFASAGNTAQRHWSGLFQGDSHGLHQWRPGQSANLLLPWSRSSEVRVELYGQSGADYEVTIRDPVHNTQIGRSLSAVRAEHSVAEVHFVPHAQDPYQVRVRLLRGQGGPFHLAALGATLACVTAHGSVSFPADGPEVIAVGAVTSNGHRQRYSSCGPNSASPKPDLVAPVPFPSMWRTKPFAGTSAAAPQAAALAALCWSRHPQWTASAVRSALINSAADLGAPGHDCETGYGMIRLP